VEKGGRVKSGEIKERDEGKGGVGVREAENARGG